MRDTLSLLVIATIPVIIILMAKATVLGLAFFVH